MARAAVIRFPGSNCEVETARVLTESGVDARIYNWNEIDTLSVNRADAYILPGGFSFQDRVRAGVIAARERIMDVVYEEAVAGKPVLGICNGAQVLLESGLVPGWKPGAVQAALASNFIPGRSGYLAKWIFLKKASGSGINCPWLSAMGEDAVPVPIAHAEGRFMFRTTDVEKAEKQVGLVYCTSEGEDARCWPDNPNGSALNAAGLMNAEGNVLAMMPHPERAFKLWQVPPGLQGPWGERRRTASVRHLDEMPGPGSVIFMGLARYLGVKK
jgi:phosphoribosylformylglycinamidine synthase I